MEKNFTAKFTKATASVKRDAFLAKVHANPKLTLKQVFDLGAGEFSGCSSRSPWVTCSARGRPPKTKRCAPPRRREARRPRAARRPAAT
ncbi:hypothetical protein [Nannocystis pusilla]|uniref:hypothetical protein n=1 Tax=Nannocystis pusilla TaxID=889268 RepID=UPI003B7EC430